MTIKCWIFLGAILVLYNFFSKKGANMKTKKTKAAKKTGPEKKNKREGIKKGDKVIPAAETYVVKNKVQEKDEASLYNYCH